MAAARVFAIAELTEAILLRLPTKDLLLSKSVCKAFRDAHDGSSSIKKALFLLPGNANDTAADARYPNARYPFSARALTKMWNEDGYEVPIPETTKHGGMAFNPLLMKLNNHRLMVLPKDIGKASRITVSGALLRTSAQASCRKMYWTQPPLDLITTCVNTGPFMDLSWEEMSDFIKFLTVRLSKQQGDKLLSTLMTELKESFDQYPMPLEKVSEWYVALKAEQKTSDSKETAA